MEGKKMLKMMVLGIVVVLCAGRAVLASEVVAWGRNDVGQCDVPEPNAGFIAVAGGVLHSLGLKADSSIAAWGYNKYGQCDVPEPNEGFVAVTAGELHSLGLKADGSIAGWGWNAYGQCNVPEPNEGFVAVAAGRDHSLGLKADGSIVAWGWNAYGQCNVPEPNEGFVAVAGGGYHSLGLKADGSIVTWGLNNSGQCDVAEPNEDFVAVAGGRYHSLGLKADGSIVAWGDNSEGQCTVPLPNTGFIAVAGGAAHSLGLKGDGSIVAWGYNAEGQCNVPEPNAGFAAVAGGGYHSLGLKGEPMGTAITYQGRLIDANSTADGPYDFEFRLYDSRGVQQGNTVKAEDLDVIDGYFTVELDFGSDVFNGLARWLEVGVRPFELEDPNVYTVLTPRQEVTPTSYALHAKTAESIAAGGYVETDPQVGAISNNYVPKWDGSALVTSTIYDNGNVGIGTMSPSHLLDVDGSLRLRQSGGGNPAASLIELGNRSGSRTYGINFNVYYDGSWKYRSSDEAASIGFEDDGDLVFSTMADGTANNPLTFSPRITIKNNGKVGIGTSSPTYKLDIEGGATPLQITAGGPAYPKFRFDVETGGYSVFRMFDNNTFEDFRLATNGDSWLLGPGNVGIGTIGPAEKLDVAGNVTAAKYYDRNNTSYYLDPDSISLCNDMRADIFYDRNNTGYYVDPASSGTSANFAGNVYATRYYDRNNTSYYVDPASISYCNDMRASIFYDRDNTGYYVNPASTSYCNDMRVNILYDRNNTGYYVNPASVSNLYDLRVQGPVYMLGVYSYSHGLAGRDVKVTNDGRLGTLLSSKRFKENIAPLEDDFTKILEARPVAFTWKESKEPDIGLIAEDIDELGLRNLVFYDAQGRPDGVRYDFISLYLLEVLKDQASSIKELKAENELLKEQLKTQNQSVKQRLGALERTIQKIAKAKEVQL